MKCPTTQQCGQGMDYWRQRSFESAYLLEKQFYENDLSSFTRTLQDVHSDYREISRDFFWHIYFQTYSEMILPSLARLSNEQMEQNNWITEQMLENLFETKKLNKKSWRWVDRTTQNIKILILAARIKQYKIQNSKFPESLDEIAHEKELLTDVTGRPFVYTHHGETWFLKGCSSNNQYGYDSDINNHVPIFPPTTLRDVVFYPDLASRQRELFEKGEIHIGRVSTELSSKHLRVYVQPSD